MKKLHQRTVCVCVCVCVCVLHLKGVHVKIKHPKFLEEYDMKKKKKKVCESVCQIKKGYRCSQELINYLFINF